MNHGLNIQSKKEHPIRNWVFAIIIVGIMVVAGWYGYLWYTAGVKPPLLPVPASAMADPTVDETPVSTAAIDSHAVASAQPRYISIPSLGITKTRVMSVGLTANNMLDTPKNINDTAWYDKSALPGSGAGAVVIDGHNGGITKDGVFAKLADMKVGDSIIIERGDGKIITYDVAENKVVSLQQANEVEMQNMMKPFDNTRQGLSLITCAGNWVPRDKVFDKRVMLRAVAVE